MLLALAEVQTMAGVPDAVSHFTEAAHSSDDPYVRIRALEANGWWWGLRPDAVDDDLAQIDTLIGSLPEDAGRLGGGRRFVGDAAGSMAPECGALGGWDRGDGGPPRRSWTGAELRRSSR